MNVLFRLILGLVHKAIFSYSSYEWFKGKMLFLRSFWLRGVFASCDKSVRFGKIGWIHHGGNISIGAGSYFGDYFYLTTWPECSPEKKFPKIEIGCNCSFAQFFHITAANQISIGNNVLVGKWVTISDNNHGSTFKESLLEPPSQRAIVSKGAVFIDDDVWIGDKATILSGVTIGKGAVIAANAVVTKNVPAYCVVAGNPAKIIRKA